MVDSSDVHADLEAIVAIAEIEDELEMAWAENALACECTACTTAIERREAPSFTNS